MLGLAISKFVNKWALGYHNQLAHFYDLLKIKHITVDKRERLFNANQFLQPFPKLQCITSNLSTQIS